MTNKGKVSIGMAFVGALALALAAPALAGPGADVIVGDIQGVQTNGVSGSYASWSLGTTSCNKGDVPFLWISGTNQHPVIAQNLFRVIPGADGKVRQLGQSWLKHGFTALQGNVCNFGCTAYPDGSRLGVGCSDPYSASLNGGQSGAGPKSEVNAATGVFTYPVVNLGINDSVIAKRLQALTSDINVAGAIYFGECQYVAQDDATNNNKNNNASYRRVTFANDASLTISAADSTQRERPAIYAWKDHGLGLNTPDPNVNITLGDVIGDGRFILACKTWQVNATTWHYEYAVHNLNSHRSGQQLRINFPAGTVISNTGFYNVPYHSGEPHSNTPWTISVASDNITWSGPAYTGGNDLSANALRWGTMYNFWFDATIAPVLTGGVQLALFRPGSNGNAIQFVTQTPGGLVVAPPVNDDCANAITLVDGTYGFSTAGATSAGPDECTASSSAAINQDIWFRYVVGSAGTMTVSTCGSDFDTRLAVYSDACPSSTPLTAIACNDDSNCDGTAGNELQASVSFAATADQVLFIRVGGYQTAYGNVTLSITGPTTLGACCLFGGCSIKTAAECTGSFISVGSQCSTGTCPIPANDSCANAIAVSDGVPVSGGTIAGTDDGGSSCGSSSTSPDMWYSYTPAVNATVTFSTCAGSDYDTVLSIHTACPVGATTNQITNACNDDTSGCGSGRQSRIAVALTAGTRYLVRVTGWNGATGNYTLLVSGGQGVAPPTNDNCSGRIGVNAGVYAISTVSATTDGPAHVSCLSRGDNTIDKDIWFNYPSTANGMLTVQVCATTAALDPFISIYDGYGCADFEARLMGCNDQSSACGGTNNATLTVPVVNGTSYTIRVGGYNNTSGPATMTLSFNGTMGACCESTSVCHLVAGSAACTGAGGTYHGDNSTCEGTTNNPITCCPANFDQNSGVNSDDLFAFLDDWFAQNGLSGPGFSTDINQSGNVDSDDLFGFLDIWFAGCGG